MSGILVEVAWKSTVVMAAAFAAAYAFRRGSAATRHFVWTSAFAGLLLLPLLVARGPKWAALPLGDAAAESQGGVPDARIATGTAVVVRAARPAAPPRVPFVWLYVAGALMVLTRFGVGLWRTRKMVRGAAVAGHAVGLVEELRNALGIRRRVRALESSEAAVPMTWGIVRPVALLPATASEWPAARLRTVVLHELVHVQRHDLLAQTVAQAACCLYWFHPLAWLAARELRKERERACDDAVLNGGVVAADYAGHLMEMARSMAARHASLADAPAMAGASDLESRVRALLDRGQNRRPLSRRVALTIATLACALVLPVATLTTHAQAGRGALAGIITDPSGARVPKAAITARSLDGTNQETAVANSVGEYGFAAIPPGRYAVEVRVPGFRPNQKEVVVMAGTAARVDVGLELGDIAHVITIHGSRTTSAPVAAQAAGTPERIPIGGNVQMAKLIRQPRAVYPPELRLQGITGTVRIRMIVSKTGEVMNPKVLNTDVHPMLAQAALDAVMQWRYQPTLLNGQPVEMLTTVEATFELDQ